MKNIRSVSSVAALLLLCWISIFPQSSTPPLANSEAPIANNGQPINDYANVIDDATEAALNQKIKDFKARTNPPVVLAVATVQTTGDRAIFDYSLSVARGWKIGSKFEDNPSALLFIAVQDRKYFTQVSRDLEDELPDGLVGQLQRQYLVPAFRQGDYAKGISDTIDAYIRTIDARADGTAVPTPEATQPQNPRGNTRTGGSFSTRSICCVIAIVVLLLLIFSRGGGNRRGGGGGFGGGSALPWIIGSILANSGNSRGSSWGGGGSSWGGSSGGGSDWGGFGGGGDFGGGGAGGDW